MQFSVGPRGGRAAGDREDLHSFGHVADPEGPTGPHDQRGEVAFPPSAHQPRWGFVVAAIICDYGLGIGIICINIAPQDQIVYVHESGERH